MGNVAGRRKRIIGTTVALVAIGGGAAFAYWTATGKGDTTSATAAKSADFTIAAGAWTGAELSPGGAEQTATITVTNPGTGVQKLQSVAVAIATTDGTPWTVTGCSAADFTASVTIDPAEIAPGGTATGTVTLQMVNTNADQNGCKGKTVPLHFTAS